LSGAPAAVEHNLQGRDISSKLVSVDVVDNIKNMTISEDFGRRDTPFTKLFAKHTERVYSFEEMVKALCQNF